MESLLVLQGVGERRSWDVQFLCDFNNWELELVRAFSSLHSLILLPLRVGTKCGGG